jgi:anti-sigma B factor antagonist
MDIQVSEQVTRLHTISLSGRLDAFNAPELREHFQHLLDDGAKQFILDLRRVDFMDSAALAALVNLLKHARQAGGDVEMMPPESQAAHRILTLTKFDRVFRMIDNPVGQK